MTLNQGQAAAAEEVFQFLLSDEKELKISGGAGVGKTYLMRHIMDTLMTRYEDACQLLNIPQNMNTIELTATTNKAAEVLATATGCPTSTIHSFLNLKVRDDYKTGKTKIDKTPAWTVYSGVLLFIDEASMIDGKLKQFILEGTDKTCKIIYIGDHNQLAPVTEKISPIYTEETGHIILTEPMRNAEQPALMALCKQLRDTVETNEFKPIREVPGVVDFIDEEQFQALIDDLFVDEEVNSRILCYTNNRVKEYNDYIRGIRGRSDILAEGELIINNSGIQIGKTMLRVEQEFRVTKVSPHVIEINVDTKDPDAIMDVYEVEIQDTQSHRGFVKCKVPVHKDHYTALMKHYAKQKHWPVYFNLKNNYPDLRQKDACTVHKSQGSTYESVFIDLINIGTCRQADQTARMLYVAASRATTRVYMFGQLPPKYRGE